MIAVTSLGLQIHNRRIDKHNEAADAHFDAEISGPLRASYGGLHGLRSRLMQAASAKTSEKRIELINSILEHDSPAAFGPFASAAAVADLRCETGGFFSDIEAELEDVVYTQIGMMKSVDGPEMLSAPSKEASSALASAIAKCDVQLRDERLKHRKKFQSK